MAKNDMGIFGKGLVYLLRDFSCWTSTHGIPHIGMANNFILRIFWVLIVCGCFLGFFVQLRMLITKFLSYQVNTETKLEFKERSFPVITVCHLNPWKKDVSNAESAYLRDMMTAYTDAGPNANFGFQKRNIQRQQRAVRLNALISESLITMAEESDEGTANSTLNDIAYTYDDLVASCTYNAITCNASDFVYKYDPYFGRCIQYNKEETQVSSRAGPLYGLRLVIRTDQETYLPWTDSAGVVVTIHNTSQEPYPDVFGYYAGPGIASSFGIRYIDTSRQPAPYGDCTRVQDLNLPNYVGAYQVEACYRSCVQEEIIKQCGCYAAFLPYLQGDKYPSCYVADKYDATSKNLDCVDGVMANNGTGGFNIIKSCACPQPCNVQTYVVTVSNSFWPSDKFMPNECASSVGQADKPWMLGQPSNMSNGEKQARCVQWYNKNTLLVEMFYERMNYQLLSESPAYTLVSCISDIGGQVGLFLGSWITISFMGMSIISVFEFLTLLLLVCYYVSSHRSRKRELEELDEYVKKVEAENAERERAQELKEKKRRAAQLRAQAENDETDEDGKKGHDISAKRRFFTLQSLMQTHMHQPPSAL